MKIQSWNGIRTIKQYHPWNSLNSFDEIMLKLEGDIICLQEIKATQETLPSLYTHCRSFNIFYGLHKQKAYSGVGTFVRKPLMVHGCEIGFTGTNGGPHLGSLEKLHQAYDLKYLMKLDAEGRVVITDHGDFVLFNVYFPLDSNPERSQFKLDFSKAINIRAESFIEANRNVIICGDFNVSHREIDHCDPVQSNKDRGLDSFELLPSRIWFDEMVKTSLLDTFRIYHPDRKNAFTCWNTLTNARGINYGTRIDYILVSSSLKDKLLNADIQPDLLGSDHCPVYLDIDLTLDSMKGKPPKGCTCYWDSYGGKQRLMDAFLVKKVDQSKIDLKTTKSSKEISKVSKKVKETKQSTFFKPLLKKTDASVVETKPASVSTSSTLSLSEFEYEGQLPEEFRVKNEAKDAWTALLKSKSTPQCFHSIPSIKKQCKKPGPDYKKYFYSCSKDLNDRCSFFQWL